MFADFWAGYISGAAGIIIGNPLDLLKVRLQSGTATSSSSPLATSYTQSAGGLVKGVAAPILGYGALNALLFVSYNRTLNFLGQVPAQPSDMWAVWSAGAVGGLATWVVSAPTELIKCRTQSSGDRQSSFSVTKELFKIGGIKGLYHGGGVTSLRDAVGYGFYFWSYELMKQCLGRDEETGRQAALKVLLCGGSAGVITWASIFPLDVIKTRVQVQPLPSTPIARLPREEAPLLQDSTQRARPDAFKRLGAVEIARDAYQNDGIRVFFRGLGVCSARAFLVNAVQWAIYEWVMQALQPL